MQILRPANMISGGIIVVLLAVLLAVVGAKATPWGGWPGLVPVLFGLWGLRKPLRRWHLARSSFPAAGRTWLEAHVPFYRHLDATGRIRFERDVRFFLDDQRFEAVQDAPATEQHRLAVAAGAALMLHGRPDWELSRRRTFLFYPTRFDEDYYDTDTADFDGMVHPQGPVILAVDAIEEGWQHPHDGSNVVLHELAHLFDFNTDGADGFPALMDRASAGAWVALVRREMRQVIFGRSMLRRYAAKNPAEFFAVATENFFERPDVMAEYHPELFEAMTAFYHLDPRIG
jgi:Mlc titration factor MtfA (ptsG expression regulator)